jgi:hypothetical protein
MKYYVYQHIRLDNNQVFYIGKGTKKTKGNVFHRAYTKNSRNEYWLRISKITSYKVEIVEQFESETECLKYESELIKKYGFSWNNTGTLCNIVTDDNEIRRLGREKSNKIRLKSIYQYSLDGDFIRSFNSVTEAKKIYKADIYNAVSGRSKTSGGFQWRYEKFERIEPYSVEVSKMEKFRTVYQYTKDLDFVREWKGCIHPAKELNINQGSIRNCLCGVSKSAGGFIWSFSKIQKNLDTFYKYEVQKNGKVVHKSNSLKNCAEFVGLSPLSASSLMRRNYPYKGYVFKSNVKTKAELKSK